MKRYILHKLLENMCCLKNFSDTLNSAFADLFKKERKEF